MAENALTIISQISDDAVALVKSGPKLFEQPNMLEEKKPPDKTSCNIQFCNEISIERSFE